LLDGPLFGAFGPYGMDGSRTPRSEMVRHIARWVAAPEQERLWQSRPVRGEVGIVYAPETQLFTYAQQGEATFYAESMQGAYQGFFDGNIQADWVHIDDIATYRVLYLPFPVMLTQATADRLRRWVEAGGALICEGCPGYWGDRAHVGVVQPNLGLDTLFGARETYAEFTPDLLGDLRLRVGETPVWGGIYLQAYAPTTGDPSGWYEDGRVAAVDHAYGRGRTRLIGTMVGAGYAAHPADRSPAFFRELLRWAGAEQHVWCSEPRVKARLHEGPGGTYLWVANPTGQALSVHLRLGERWRGLAPGRSLWGVEVRKVGDTIRLLAGARDVAVVPLG
ncbi:MAG: beta-galactosidase, partial [Chloroflexi bacterium]|nr:beta-galactosidase [Chloroflexota bacterium]